jgi:hypothetical protein
MRTSLDFIINAPLADGVLSRGESGLSPTVSRMPI